MKSLYLIGGTMGVGMTTVCNVLKKELPNAVVLDGDWCWVLHPFRVTQTTKAMVMENIHAVLNSFLRCPDIENVVFCWVMHEQQILDDILSALELEDVRVIPVSLICAQTELKHRLAQDVQNGLRTADILDRSIQRLALYDGLNTVKIDTTGTAPEQITRQIREEGSGI